jgi:bacterioferritin
VLTASVSSLATRSHAEYDDSTALLDVVREDLIAERVAIESYSEIIRWLGDKDSTTRRMLEEILSMEEEHANDLLCILEDMNG